MQPSEILFMRSSRLPYDDVENCMSKFNLVSNLVTVRKVRFWDLEHTSSSSYEISDFKHLSHAPISMKLRKRVLHIISQSPLSQFLDFQNIFRKTLVFLPLWTWKIFQFSRLVMDRITAAVNRMLVCQPQLKPRCGCDYHNRGYFFSTTAYILRNFYSRKSLFYLF